MTDSVIIRHKFPALMDLISQALVPAYIAEHIFANKDKIAAAMQEGKIYSFNTPTGETIEIEWENV